MKNTLICLLSFLGCLATLSAAQPQDNGAERYFLRADRMPVPPKLSREITKSAAQSETAYLIGQYDKDGRLIDLKAMGGGALIKESVYSYGPNGKVKEEVVTMVTQKKKQVIKYNDDGSQASVSPSVSIATP